MNKTLLAKSQWYIKPTGNSPTMGASTTDKRKSSIKSNNHEALPLELVLMRSRGTDVMLPELVDTVEDDGHFYYVTRTHGITQRRAKALKTWFKARYYRTFVYFLQQ